MTKAATSIVTYKYAERPPASQRLLSITQPEELAVLVGNPNAHLLTSEKATTMSACQTCGGLMPRGNGAACRNCAKKDAVKQTVASAGAKGALPDEDKAAEKLMELSSKTAKKNSKPSGPPTSSPFHKAIKHVGFKFVEAATVAEGAVAYGYVYKDGRAALLTVSSDGVETWAVRWPGAQGGETGGRELAGLTKALSITTARRNASLARTAKRLETDAAKAAALTERQLAAAKDLDIGRAAAPPVTQKLPDGPPDHVLKALSMLGTLTAQQFNLDLLRGDKHYSNRVALLRTVLNRARGDYKAKETGINNVTQVFYSAVGVGEGRSAAARAKEFEARCKQLTAAYRAACATAKREEKKARQTAWRVEREKYTVPGVIIPPPPKKSKKQRAEEDAQARKEIFALAASAEQPALPHPDAELTVIAGDLRLLEDPVNGLVMMQMERENSQGAICIYNNGSRVAAGVVPPETLRKLRPVPPDVSHGVGSNEMLLQAAHQFLNPIVPSVPVTPVAARHLTAVIHCKELIPMTPEATTKKFAPPAKSIGKAAAKATPKASKKSVATGKQKASGGHRLNEEQTIKIVAKENPYKKGTKAFDTFVLIAKCKTVGEVRSKADAEKHDVGYLRYASRDGYIKLS